MAASLGTLGPVTCSPASILSGMMPGTAGLASVRVASLSSLSGVAPGFLSSPGTAPGFPGTKLMRNVETYGEELLKLCKELTLPPHKPGEGLSILQLEKELWTQVDILAKKKHERIKQVKKLKEIFFKWSFLFQDQDQDVTTHFFPNKYFFPPSQSETTDLTNLLVVSGEGTGSL